MRLSPCVLVQPDGWARGEREGYGEPCDVTSLSLSLPKTPSTRPKRHLRKSRVVLEHVEVLVEVDALQAAVLRGDPFGRRCEKGMWA